jgi:hypothetical protein
MTERRVHTSPLPKLHTRDFEKFREQGGQRHALIANALRRHLKHWSPWGSNAHLKIPASGFGAERHSRSTVAGRHQSDAAVEVNSVAM